MYNGELLLLSYRVYYNPNCPRKNLGLQHGLRLIGSMYSETGLGVLLGGVGDEIADTAGVTPLVVVPGDKLDEGVGKLDAGLGVEDGGVGVADEVGGDDSLVGVLPPAGRAPSV